MLPGLAPGQTPAPSAKDLWEEYPLETTPEAGEAAPSENTSAFGETDASGASELSARTAAARDDDDGGGVGALSILAIALAAVAGGVSATLISRRRRAGRAAIPAEKAIAPAEPASLNGHAPPADRARQQPWMAASPRPGSARPEPARQPPAPTPRKARAAAAAAARSRDDKVAPPDPQVAWTAEVAWRETDDGARFDVVAEREDGSGRHVIAASTSLEWPPASAESVQALTVATERLEAALLAAGWVKRQRGGAWYAHRYGWEPVAAPPPQAPSSPRAPSSRRAPSARPASSQRPARAGAVPQAPPKRTLEPAARFARGPRAWPDGVEDSWRCEVGFKAGVVHSHFRVLAFAPGSWEGEEIAGSDDLKWQFMADPDPYDRSHRREAARLDEALRAVGWQPVGRGPHWYAGRYVWHGKGDPPSDLDLGRAEPAGAPPTGRERHDTDG
jgi:hypothetical protein